MNNIKLLPEPPCFRRNVRIWYDIHYKLMYEVAKVIWEYLESCVCGRKSHGLEIECQGGVDCGVFGDV